MRPTPPKESKDLPSPTSHRPGMAPAPPTSNVRKSADGSIIYTPRANSGNRGPRRVYDYLETKLVLRHLPSMVFSTSPTSSSSSDEDASFNEGDDEIEDGKKRPDSPRPEFESSEKLIHKFHNVDKYYL